MRIYLLKNRGKRMRIYGTCLGKLEAKIADYTLYMDYKGREWLHIHIKGSKDYLILPFVRLDSGEEYLEYIKHI